MKVMLTHNQGINRSCVFTQAQFDRFAALSGDDNPIHVEGFTDDLPIRTAQYPTNWELSSARSASIVRMLAMQGVNPARMASVG